MTALSSYDWPGNIRELQNVLLRYLTMGRLDFMNADRRTQADEPASIPAINFNRENLNLQAAVENLEKTLILRALAQTKGNKSKAAMLLGISRRALFRKMAKLEMKPSDSGILAHH